MASTFGAIFNLQDPNVTEALLAKQNLLRGVTETTWASIQSALADGEMAGDSIDQIAGRIRRVFTQASGYRSRMIARTETIGAANAGSLAGARQSGVVGQKVWLAARDHRTRSTHIAADGQKVGVDEKFAVGASRMDHPHDPAGGASEVVNCRCTMLFERSVPGSVTDVEAPEKITPVGRPKASKLKPVGAKPSANLSNTVRTKGGKLAPVRGKVAKAIERAKKVIDSIHGSPELTANPDGLPLIQTSGAKQLGHFRYYNDGRPVWIGVSSSGDAQGFCFAHEFGHFFDFRDLGNPGMYTSTRGDNEAMTNFLRAVQESKAWKELDALAKRSRVEVTLPDGTVVNYRTDYNYIRYLRSPYEVFARAYSQWIAVESGDEDLLAGLNWWRGKKNDAAVYYPAQWEDDDFEPIAAALRALFQSHGLVE